jgi:hypothetical protein
VRATGFETVDEHPILDVPARLDEEFPSIQAIGCSDVQSGAVDMQEECASEDHRPATAALPRRLTSRNPHFSIIFLRRQS